MAGYPNLKRHLDKYAPIITSDNKPYGLHRARNKKFFEGAKIIALRKALQPTFSITDFPCYVSQMFNVIKTDRVNLKYLVALLNSRLVRFWLKQKGKMQGHHFQVDQAPLLTIPVLVPDASTQDRIGSLVDRIILVQDKMHSETITQAEYTRLERLMTQADAAIQDEVEQLYGLEDWEKQLIADMKNVGEQISTTQEFVQELL